MVNGLKPIYDNNSKILILGSLPSEKSIKNQEYYNNPTNHFWKNISNIFENKTTYTFKSFDEMINTPFLEDEEKIIDNLDKITC